MINQAILNQLETIPELTSGNLQIIACAGSGKTEFVAHRIAYMLAAGKARARETAAFTFTERAGQELRLRVIEKVQALTGRAAHPDGLYIGTIHGFCRRLLDACIPGFSAYTVLDDLGRRSLLGSIKTAIDYAGLNGMLKKRGEVKSAGMSMECWIFNEFTRALDIVREEMLDLRSSVSLPAFVKGAQVYLSTLARRQLIDFSGLLHEGLDLIRNRTEMLVRDGLLPLHLTVDEYQDINPIQEAIIRMLADNGARVCVVGDDDQAVYQWRGADVSNILTFSERYENVHIHTLSRNYRCTDIVTALAADFISHINSRLAKIIEPCGRQGEEGDIYRAVFDDQAAEIEFLICRMRRLIGTRWEEPNGTERPIQWSDMAIFFRSVRTQARFYLEALEEAGIPYVVEGRDGLFAKPEIDVLFRTMAYIGDFAMNTAGAVRRVPEPHELIERAGRVFSMPGNAALADKLVKLKTVIFTRRRISVQEVFTAILALYGMDRPEMHAGTCTGLWDNLGCLSRVIASFEDPCPLSDPGAINRFCWFVIHHGTAHAAAADRDCKPLDTDAVRVMTLHAAKGLSFPAVFMPGLIGSKTDQAPPVFLNPLAFPWGRYCGTDEDERRLFYTGITRSRKYLSLSSSCETAKGTQKPSVMLDDLDRALCLPAEVPDPTGRPKVSYPALTQAGMLTINYPGLKDYLQCGHAYRMRHIYGFRSVPTAARGYVKSLQAIIGHLTEKSIRDRHLPSEDEIKRMVDNHFSVRFASHAERQQLTASAAVTAVQYKALLEREGIPSARDRKHFTIHLDNAMIIGEILTVTPENGKPLPELVRIGKENGAELPVELEAAIQSLADGEQGDGSAGRIRSLSLQVSRAKAVEIAAAKRDRKKIRDQIVNSVNGIRENGFPAEPCSRKVCRACDWHALCPGKPSFLKRFMQR